MKKIKKTSVRKSKEGFMINDIHVVRVSIPLIFQQNPPGSTTSEIGEHFEDLRTDGKEGGIQQTGQETR